MILRRVILPLVLVVVVGAVAAWFWLLHTESGARFAWQRVVNAADGKLTAQSIEGDFSSGVRLSSTNLIAGNSKVSVGAVLLAVDVDLLPLVVKVETLHVDSVAIRRQEAQDAPDDDTATTSPVPNLALPLRIVANGVTVTDTRIARASEDGDFIVTQVTFDAEWQEQIQISDLQIEVAEPQLGIAAEVAGTAEKFRVMLSIPQYGASLAAEIVDLQAAEITSLVVDYSDITASGSAVVNWVDGLNVAGELSVPRANVAAFATGWPARHPLAAELAFEFSDARIALSESRLRILGTETSVVTDGVVELDTGRVDAVLEWQRLQWPFVVTEPQFQSDSGKISVQGTLDNWQIDGVLELAAAGVDDGVLRVAGRGDGNSLDVRIVEGSALGGTLSGDVAWSWAQDNAWSAALDLDGIQLGALLRQLPATLSGHMDIGHEKIVAKNLSLVRGDDRALLNGDALSTAGLAFEMAVADIGFYLPDGAGSVAATGTLSLVNENPYLRINASSDWLSYAGMQAFDVQARDLQSDGDALALDIVATELAVAGEQLRNVTTTLRVARERQMVDASFEFGDVSVATTFAGKFDHWDSPDEWRGQMTKLDIGLRDFEPVTIDAPADVVLSANRVDVTEFCLRAASDASICTGFAWASGQRFDIAANFQRIPVEVVNDFENTGFSFEQMISGNLNWQTATGRRPTGSANVSISPGHIRSDEDPDFDVVTEAGGLAFEIVNGTLLAGDLWLPMPGTGDINGHFEASDIAAGLASPISGNIDASIADISIAAVFSPLIDRAAGALVADIDISGTVEEPRMMGSLTLDAGQISYRPLGLTLNEVEVRAEFDEERHVIINGSFLAGEGRASFETSAAYAATDATGIQMRLRGNNLTLINVPDVQAVANADLTLRYEANSLRLGGVLDFPQAHIVPENLTATSASESGDVVIVAGELKDRDVERSSPLEVFGELSVTLGPEVVVDLGVAQANVAGQARFAWNGDTIPVANGRYDMSGDIRAFGQVLEVTEGGIRFENVAANDPYIRVRAERQIYGNSQIKRAGVLVEGRLPRPSIVAYTNPATTEERALALLVTGSDFDYESGTGAIDFGTYIAPRLFVSYGVGIFERDNVISARYDLKRGFGIKVTSGQTDSGVDLTYSYEN